MDFLPMVFRVLYWIVNAPYANGETSSEAEAIEGKSPALEYG